MPYTTLHRAVDAQPGPITAEIVSAAVELRLAETEELDWKQDTDDLKDGREVVKDFAAMANTRGGVIVYGVEEDGSDRAKQLTGLEAERARDLVTRFRRLAPALARPFIPALRIYRLLMESDPERWVVVAEVPRSPEAPHLVSWEKEFFGFPRRIGDLTVWLGEAELETAYARRSRLRQDSSARLGQLAVELRTHLQGPALGSVRLAAK